MSVPLWCVVITTRNRAQMLKRAIESCVNQTVTCDVLVIDEASTDLTPEIVKSFPGVKYIRNAEPLGHSASANKGIQESRTQWIKPLDDDDWLTPNCIEVMSNALAKAYSAGIVPTLISGVAANVTAEGREIGRTRSPSEVSVGLRSRELLTLMMLDQAPIGTPVQVGHSREAALRVGGWNEQRSFKHQHGDEVELWIKMAAAGDAVFIPDLVGYRTVWAGGSQQIIPPEERYRSNLFLKDQIAIHLGRGRPRDMGPYLALHWAIVAVKEKRYGEAFKLGLKWIRRPTSAVKLLNRRSFKDAEKLIFPI
jgi:glycosyltransferase involved in cell wall biosynthesis